MKIFSNQFLIKIQVNPEKHLKCLLQKNTYHISDVFFFFVQKTLKILLEAKINFTKSIYSYFKNTFKCSKNNY